MISPLITHRSVLPCSCITPQVLLSPNLLIVYYQTVIDQTLAAPQPTFELDFSSTIKMSDQQNDSFI